MVFNRSKKLSQNAERALDEATVNGEAIYIPSICLIEMTYLVEKGRLPAIARERLIRAIDDPAMPCRLASLDRRVVDAIHLVSRSEVPDMPDRIIAGTALALQLPLVSRDSKIRASHVQTIW